MSDYVYYTSKGGEYVRRAISGVKGFFSGLDKLFVFLTFAASCFGTLMVTSATRFMLTDDRIISRDAVVMIIAVAVGLLISLLVSVIDYEWIGKMWPFIGIFCILLMLFTRVFGVAPEARTDARSWIAIGTFYFQSSELVKIGFVITFAMHLELVKDTLNNVKSLIPLGIHAALPAGLVILCGDLGSAIIFMLTAVAMLFFAGLHWGYFAAGGLLAVAAAPLIWLYGFGEYQKNRFLALLHPELYTAEIYQQDKGLTALGSGGWFGQGLFHGTYTQNGIVPESENDMIFTVIGEELGFIGCLLALLLLAAIVFKIISIGRKARDFSVKLMCYGVAAMIAFQIAVNIGMCLMILPVIGITLPFFSAGGSSTLCLYVGMGLILSIYRYNRNQNIINFHLRNIHTPFSERN